MKIMINAFFLLTAILAALGYAHLASAHTSYPAGDYEIEVGWVDEPAIAGQRNAFVVNVSNTKDAAAKVDVSKLTVEVIYGGQTKALELQPASEDAVNQFIAPIIPAIPGQYTLRLSGMLDASPVTLEAQPEEVKPASELAFPTVKAQVSASANQVGGPDTWLAGAALVIGLAGLGLSAAALRRGR